MRKPIIAGNWKMNMTQSESINFIKELTESEFTKDREIVVCTPFTSLSMISDMIEETPINLGAQNVYFEDSGAYTGEISAEMLKDLLVDYVIVGHSERREIFNETDEDVNKKLLKVLEKDMHPILCVGETLEERDSNAHFDKVKSQVENCLKDVSSENIKDVVIAYEPIWAIGTGKSASSDDAEEMCSFIRKNIEEIYSKDEADTIRIQYGGSVKPETINELMAKENIDGALVGGASLKVKDFTGIVNYEVINE